MSFDGKPAPVDDALITDVQHHLEVVVKGGAEPCYGLKQGDEVAINAGPFAGYRAVFDMSLPGKDRVRVLLQMLGDRSISVELDATKVKPR